MLYALEGWTLIVRNVERVELTDRATVLEKATELHTVPSSDWFDIRLR